MNHTIDRGLHSTLFFSVGAIQYLKHSTLSATVCVCVLACVCVCARVGACVRVCVHIHGLKSLSIHGGMDTVTDDSTGGVAFCTHKLRLITQPLNPGWNPGGGGG